MLSALIKDHQTKQAKLKEERGTLETGRCDREISIFSLSNLVYFF